MDVYLEFLRATRVEYKYISVFLHDGVLSRYLNLIKYVE